MTSTTVSSFRPWHVFVLAALVAATVAILVAKPSDPVVAVLLTLAIGAGGLVGLMTYRTIRPLTQRDFSESTAMSGSRTRAAVDREKTLVLRSIKELEFDRAMGKVSTHDFEEMGGRLRTRAISLMKQLDLEAVDFLAVIEDELRGRLEAAGEDPAAAAVGAPAPEASGSPAMAPEESVCEGCETANDPDARFCKGCGKPL
jgi:hypothetical protein